MSKTTIPTGGITDATIATGDIADDAVTVAKTSGVGFGVQNVDQFRLTSNFTGDAQPIASNLSRVSEVGAAGGAVGSQMAVSSGIFTFPQTGMYLVEFVSQASWTSTSFFHTTFRYMVSKCLCFISYRCYRYCKCKSKIWNRCL